MGRTKGRKILGVILFCFVFCAFYGLPASAVRNNLSPLLPLSNASVFLLFTTKDFDNQLVYSIPGVNDISFTAGEDLPFSIVKVITTPVCSGEASTIRIESIPANLPDGTYTVTYDLGAPNASTGNTATMEVTDGEGSGTFTSRNLVTIGNTLITITNLQSGIKSNPITANNTANINVSTAPVVNIGDPINPICIGGTSAPLGASIDGDANATWSCPDGGTFSDVNDPNATWTPPASYTGTATLTLTATNGCAIDSESKTVQVKSLPIVIKGPVMNPICQGGSSAFLGGSVGGSATGGTWTSSAGGTFSPSATDLNAKWTPPADFSGSAILTLTSTGSPCNISDSKTIVVQPTSVAGTASSSQTICRAEAPDDITLTGYTGDIQWQSSANNSTFNDIFGATAATLTSAQMGALTATAYYRAEVTNGVCSSVISNVVTVAVNPVSVGGTASTNQTICSGTTPSNLTLSGYTGSIQWQTSTDNSTFTDIPTATGATLSSALMGALTATTYYRAVVKSGVCPAVNSTTVTITVNTPSDAGTAAAAVAAICYGSNTTLSLTGYTGTIQWQQSPDGTSGWANVTGGSGASSATYTTPNLTATTYYRAVVTSGVCPFENSNVVTVNVNPTSAGGTASTAMATLCSGNSTTVSLTGQTGSIQWQQSPDGTSGWVNVTGGSGATSSTYTTPQLTATTYYRAAVTSGVCTTAYSSVTSVAVNPLSVGGTASANQAVCSGTTPANITLSGYTGSIQWQKSTDNSTFTDISGATGATLTSAQMGALTATTYYRAKVTSGVCTPANSSVVTVTVNPLPTAAISGTTSICAGSFTNLSVTLTGTQPWSLTYSDGTTPVTINNINSSPYSISVSPAASKTYTLTAVSDANCTGTSHTGSAVITVNPTPTAGSPGNKNFCHGVATTPINLSGTPSGVVFDIAGGVAIGLADQTGVIAIPAFTPVAGLATITLTPRANGCSGTPVEFFITVNATPTLSGASQSTSVCAGLPAVINLTGLRPNTTSTITYQINGVVQTPLTNIISNGAGNGSFTTPALTAANNGQTLQITGITTTSNTPNCSEVLTKDVVLSVNSVPVFTTCPTTLNLNADAGACTATGTYVVETSGLPAPDYTYSFSGATTGSGNGTGSGATFNAGTTNVKITATNTCGSVDCSFTVVVTDNVAPVISNCPANITVYTGAGRTTCNQVASWTEPTAADNCTPAGSLVWTKSHTPGAVFPVGTTTVTYSVKDAKNNSISCSFTVTVIDNTPPVFTPPSALTIYTDANCNVNRLPAITGNVTVKSDNCTTASSLVVGFTDAPDVAGTCSGGYSFTRTWTVSDLNGNSATGTQVITVADNIKPTLTVPPAKAISCTDSQLPANTGQATATDNCSGAVTITYTDVTAAGSCAGNSSITRTWKATDCSGNFTTANQVITITDNLSPVVTITNLVAATPDVIPLKYPSLAAFQADGGTATDDCGIVSIVLWDEVANGLEGKPGYCPTSITRTYRFTDQCGNFIDKVQTIAVQGDGGCNKCTAGTTFKWVDMMGNPSGSLVFSQLQREGKCCNATGSDDCISFNVRIDPNAVGVEILIDGATPSSQDWRIDCNPISMTNGMVCMPGGDFHLFTFCKPGGNKNTYTFRSIPGVVTGDGISTRVDCSGQITTTGILNGATWNSISPGAPGQYNSYLSSTTAINPIFTAGPDAPSVIKYEVCGNIGTTICNALGRDCAEVTINVKQKIALSLNVNPTLTCVNNPLVLVADINPSSHYTYEWHSGQGATSTPVLSTSQTLTLQPPVALGWYSLKVTDIDANGVSCSTSTFDFQVQADITGPSILTPPSGDLTVNCNDANVNTLIQNWLASATSADESGNPLAVSHDYTGISLTCGTVLPVTFTATDKCGNINTATANIRVVDNQGPIWAIAAGALDREVSCADADAYTAAQALEPTATDVCDPTLTLTKTSGAFVVGSCPHTGTYTNTWVATDDCNNNSSVYTQTITITDTTPPVFTTQAQNQTVECNGSGNVPEFNNWLANHGGATAADDCGGNITWSYSPPVYSNIRGNAKDATVTFTATDICGNSATTQATFIIDDTQGPVITCPAPATGTTDTNECFSSKIVLGQPTAVDVCSSDITFSNNAPVNFPAGVTTVTWTATDESGNKTTCEQLVTVTDNNQPPTISCPNDKEDFITTNNCSKIGVIITPPVVSDNCPNPVLTWKLTGATIDEGVGPITNTQIFNVGKTIVTYTVTDAGNHTASCSFQVWIKNHVAPKFKAIPPITNTYTALAVLDECEAPVTIESPTYDNPCGEEFTITNDSPYKTSDTDASGNYPVGVTTITWTVTDASDNKYYFEQTVTVTDDQLPVFTLCPVNEEELILNGGCEKTNVTVVNPTFKDNCSIESLTWVMTGATTESSPATGINYVSGQTFKVGITTVTYTLTDVNGLSATCSFNVWTKNLISPQFSFTCPADVTVNADVLKCDAFITTVPAPDINNPCNEFFTVTNDSPYKTSNTDASGTYPIGETTITWTITDASGVEKTCTQKVTVNDLPLTCPGNITVPADFGLTYASNVAVPSPGFSDFCSGLTLTYTMEGATTGSGNALGINLVPSSNTFNVGTTKVTYTLTHSTGVEESCSFNVIVTSRPSITCLTDITHEADAGECTYNVNPGAPTLVDGAQPITWRWVIDGPITANEATGTFVGSVGNPGPPSIGAYDFKVGVSTVTWTATNASGVDQCIQTVTVTDTQKPVFTLPTLKNGYCVENIYQAVFNEVAEDSPYDLTYLRPDYFLFAKGFSMLNLPSYIDNCALAANPISWTIDFGNDGTIDLMGTGQLSDYIPAAPLTGIEFPLGTNRITYTVRDVAGNSSSQFVDLVVIPRPEIMKN